MKRSKINFALTFVTTAVIVSVIGSVAGTLAWYAYATRATLSFSGTSAYASERVRIGIHDTNHYLFNNENIANLRSYANHNELELDEDRLIIWGKEGEGLTGDIIATYLDASPYATSELPPVTSLSREINDRLTTLYKAPFALDNTKHAAPKNYYTLLPLCFEVLDSNGDTVDGHDVWLTGFSAIDVSQPQGLKYAIRTYFENKYAIAQHTLPEEQRAEHIENQYDYFLVNPTDESAQTGSTVVAGTLDLKGDGTYDYDFGTMKEIVYGDYTGEVTYSTDPFEAPTENPLDDVNHTNKTKASTFLAAHEPGVYKADLSSVTLNRAKYDTLATIHPNEGDGGYYSGGKPVTRTAEDKIIVNDSDPQNIEYDIEYIGYTDLTIYLEGWDHAIINEVISASFNLGLQFEVNRL